LNVSQFMSEAVLMDVLEIDLSKVNMHSSKPSFPELIIDVEKADGQKCERCWHWETDVGSDPDHPTICARCVKAVKENLTE
jgi:isoleucyl-tRNA synthetase